jgi:hypothetical protein
MEELNVVPAPETETDTATVEDGALDQASQPFVGQWNQLVSTTNWEKGRIISQWRQALIDSGAPTQEYTDEAWACRVGAVTGQHVGRLRRVHDRFGATAHEYEGLYWSHFHAALDWDDAEMWLEGAVLSDWSVAGMRKKRWEAMGAVAANRPDDAEIVVAEIDEDVKPAPEDPAAQRRGEAAADQQGGPAPEGPDFGDEELPPQAEGDGGSASIYADENPTETVDFVRPFENLSELPDDLAEAFESFKLAILRHKTDDWQQISREDVLAALDALKELALAPAVD